MMRLLHGDVLSFARHYKGEPFHALLCDAPYHLTSITERFGKEGSAEAQYGKDGAFQRASKGFMGKSWDGTFISFQPETWEALGNLLYPGAFGMTFGGSRTAHRMAVAIEDAGFIIHPMIGWVYGSGFPKATRIDTQIQPKVEQEDIGEHPNARKTSGNLKLLKKDGDGRLRKPTDPLAQIWEGHRYGLQALKPALEPIIVFQKPYPQGVRPIDSITKTGAGALNIEQSRIGLSVPPTGSGPSHIYGWGKTDKEKYWGGSPGRWPSNFVLTHSPDCEQIGYQNESYQINRFTDGAKPFGDGAGHEFESEEMKGGTPIWDCVDGCPVKELDKQSGHLKSGGVSMASYSNENEGIFTPGGKQQSQFYGSSGGASRFFHQSHYDPFFYQAKASVSERENGLRGHVPCGYDECRGINTLTHIDKDGKIRECRRCIHPTIKPITLIKHLATLLLPPEEYKPRRLFVPFAGTGSEMIGAFQAGWECVIGIELEKEYVDIGRARLKYWLEQGVQLELL